MNVFLTGATGFLGGELLVTLSRRNEINRIYCFMRGKTMDEALAKIETIFGLHNDPYDREKIIPVLGDLQEEYLTLSLKKNSALQDIDVIIHSAANTSFSRIYNTLVEEVNIKGLEKILLWAKELPHLQTFLYIGTATICGGNINHRVVHEAESPNLAARHVVRYTYTKMQGELLLDKHLSAEKVLIARPYIIMGDSRPVEPRSPIILWAVATINELRLIPADKDAMLDMIPVDYAAESIVALLFVKRHYRVYHITAGEKAATSAYKLSVSLATYFNEMPEFKFVKKEMLEQIKLWAKGVLKTDSELQNYPIYLQYWNKTFTNPGVLRILLAGRGNYLNFFELGETFDKYKFL